MGIEQRSTALLPNSNSSGALLFVIPKESALHNRVVALTRPHLDHLLEVRIEGEPSPLRPSTDHPFWVKENGVEQGHWIAARELVPGELLEAVDGSWHKIEAITPVQRQETVYNFTVDKDHDYFVGQTGFLVHNADCGCGEDPLTWLEDSNLIGFTQDSIGNAIHLPDGRDAANAANRILHITNPGTYGGMDIHEITPVKFGGSPTDIRNEFPLPRGEHSPCTTWWRMIQRGIE